MPEPLYARSNSTSGLRASPSTATSIKILRVQITEVQVDRIGADPKTGDTRVFHSYIRARCHDNALARLGEMMAAHRSGRTGASTTSSSASLRHGSKQAKKVTVKLKPPALCLFKRQQFEGRIMTLLRRNGLLNERSAPPAAVAAE
jgi:hypothetical protein